MRSRLGSGLILSAVVLAVLVQLTPHVFRWLVLSEETPLTAEPFDPSAIDLEIEWENWQHQADPLDLSFDDFALSPSADAPPAIDPPSTSPPDEVRYFPEAMAQVSGGPELLPPRTTAANVVSVTASSSDTGPKDSATAKPPADESPGETKVPPPPAAADLRSVPARLEPPSNALPITPDVLPESVLQIIEQECPQASPEERKIWSDELKGLPLESIREILRLRQLIGSDVGIVNAPTIRIPMVPPTLSNLPKPNTKLLETHPLREDETAEVTHAVARLEGAREALLQAREVHVNNLANAGTPGFLGTRALLADAPYARWEWANPADTEAPPSSTSIGLGAKLAATCLDVRRGALRRTGRSMDVAVEGSGFLQVDSGEGETCFTRLGWLTRSEEGRLAVSFGSEVLPLQPPVEIPEVVHEVAISRDGTVKIRVDESSALVEIGRLELARFAGTEYLLPLGGQRFAATERSGPAVSGRPGSKGLGQIRQGVLQDSNVDPENELRALEQISRHLQALNRARALLADEAAVQPTAPSGSAAREAPAGIDH